MRLRSGEEGAESVATKLGHMVRVEKTSEIYRRIYSLEGSGMKLRSSEEGAESVARTHGEGLKTSEIYRRTGKVGVTW